MTEADAEHRHPADQLSYFVYDAGNIRGIAGAVRNHDEVEPAAEDVIAWNEASKI
jgi:hypothetical protein